MPSISTKDLALRSIFIPPKSAGLEVGEPGLAVWLVLHVLVSARERVSRDFAVCLLLGQGLLWFESIAAKVTCDTSVVVISLKDPL